MSARPVGEDLPGLSFLLSSWSLAPAIAGVCQLVDSSGDGTIAEPSNWAPRTIARLPLVDGVGEIDEPVEYARASLHGLERAARAKRGVDFVAVELSNIAAIWRPYYRGRTACERG